jgi:hypothetical protein
VSLAGDFHKTAGRVEVLANGILCHGLDYGKGHPFGAEILQRMFDELAAQTAAAKLRGNSKVRDAAFASFAIETSGNVTDKLALGFRYENTCRVRRDIVIDVTRFAPTPIVAVENAKGCFDIFLDGDAPERGDGEPFDCFQVIGAIEAERNGFHDTIQPGFFFKILD